MLVWLAVTYTFKVTVVRKINNFGVHFLANLNINLDEIQYVATTWWFVEALARFIWTIFKGENSADMTLWIVYNSVMGQDTTWFDADKLYSLVAVWLVHSRSQGYRKIRTFAVILL